MSEKFKNFIKENAKEYQEVLISWNIKDCDEYGILEYSDEPYIEEVIGDTYYVCLLCEKEFWSYKDLIKHMKEEHFNLKDDD